MTDTSPPVAAIDDTLLLRVGQAGSGLRWDAAGACWRWLDPQGGQLYAWPAAGPAGMGSHPGGQRLFDSASVLACCSSGRLLLGQGKRLAMVELPAPGQGGRALQSQVLATIDAAEPRTSISDGCADRAGNFVFGTANTASDQRPIGSFYQYSGRHGLRRLALPAVVRAGGIAFSADGRHMYFSDAGAGPGPGPGPAHILRGSYDAERAKVGNVEIFATLEAGVAGAAVVDSEDCLWSVQGGALLRYDAAGTPRQRIALGAAATASVCFGGDGLRQLLLLDVEGGLYGLAPELARTLAPGLADTPCHDGGAEPVGNLARPLMRAAAPGQNARPPR